MKKNTILAIAFSAAVAIPSIANASLALSLMPSAQTVNVGNQASVDVWVNGVSSTADAVGGFVVYLNYNGSLVSLAPVFGSQLNEYPDSSATASQAYASAFASLSATSADLFASQVNSFKLVTFTFQTTVLGTSHLTLDGASSLSNADGSASLDFTIGRDATLTAVPEPSTCVAGLVTALLAAMPAVRRRFARR